MDVMYKISIFAALAVACSAPARPELVSSAREGVVCNPYVGTYLVRPESAPTDVHRAKWLVDKLLGPFPQRGTYPHAPLTCDYSNCSWYTCPGWICTMYGVVPGGFENPNVATRVVSSSITSALLNQSNPLTTEERTELTTFQAEAAPFEYCEAE